MSRLTEANMYFFGTDDSKEVKKLFESTEEKIYIYYGSQENGYETWKSETKNPEKDLMEILEDGFSKEDAKEMVTELMQGFAEEDCMYTQDMNQQGYDIFIGIAKKSQTKILVDELKDLRREFESMF